MSKLIRYTKIAPTVFVGEKQLDFERESLAEKQLAKMFPVVSIITDSDGAKFIPIEEVFNIEKLHEQALNEAREKGRELGYEAGLKQGLTKAEEVLQQFNGAIQDTLTQRESLLEEARQKVLELVLQIAEKVTFDAITVDPESTVQMISGVIDTLIDRSRIKIRVHPDHLPIVEQNIDSFLKGAAAIKEITISSDPRVRHGGCFIETPNGDIDARLESQFEVLEGTLLSNGEDK
ncbi:MAG: hypothetical protein DRP47_00405 [Candidatus Zixiibacteriota bacterium]|nr:MAG: hypothetical protein DRP47_00405 [candidate division Zixibacteria bacterium]